MDQVNTKATFAQDDLFERKRYMDVCMKLIENHPEDRGACTIAVDAPWGVGKSTFLHMWINELEKRTEKQKARENYTLAIYYNAWENDHADDALTPILYTLFTRVSAQADAEKKLKSEKAGWLKEIKKQAGNLTASAATFATSFMLNGAAANQIGTIIRIAKDINDGKKPPTASELLIDRYKAIAKERQEFHDLLVKFVQQTKPLIIFIDELDRCKPTFAIDTLEAIKHYFNVPGLSFVFGVDMTQLGHAIAGRYGNNMDVGGYLNKFFDHRLSLPMPTIEQMLRGLRYLHISDATTIAHLNDIFRACKISPRELPLVAKASNTLYWVLWNTLGHQGQEYLRDFVYLMVSMKHRQPSVYTKFINGEPDWNIHNWDQKYAFYDLLLFYSSLVSDPVTSCKTKLGNIYTNTTTSRLANNPDKKIAKIGLGIIQCVNPSGTLSFGQCIDLFMSQVSI